MFKRILEKIELWQYSKWFRKKKQKELTATQKLNRDLINLLEFVKWLNTKGLRNRRERKIFWKKVSSGERIMESTIEHLIKDYEAKEKKLKEELNGSK